MAERTPRHLLALADLRAIRREDKEARRQLIFCARMFRGEHRVPTDHDALEHALQDQLRNLELSLDAEVVEAVCDALLHIAEERVRHGRGGASLTEAIAAIVRLIPADPEIDPSLPKKVATWIAAVPITAGHRALADALRKKEGELHGALIDPNDDVFKALLHAIKKLKEEERVMSAGSRSTTSAGR